MSKLSDMLKKASHRYCSAVVVAAGSSTRMGEDKLMMKIHGVPVLAMSLQALNGCDEIDEIIVVTQAEKTEAVAGLCRTYGVTKAQKIVVGGASRTESALAGVLQANKEAKVICIHDGARPFVTPEVVNRTVREAAQSLAAAPAIPVKDTVRVVRDGCVADTPKREELMAMQTPQAFDADLIKGALTAAVKEQRSYTDDCAAVEALGVRIVLTPGSEENIKITTPLDISLAETIAARRRGEEA